QMASQNEQTDNSIVSEITYK
ncbi:TPA: hypothetical protein ACGXOK_002923, partial [Listeria monocytogenes]